MPALVGNLVHPLARLQVYIDQVAERSQRPEVLANISDGSFYFSFLPCGRDMTSPREEIVFASEGQEPGIKAHQVAVVFGDSGGEIVVPEFTRATAELMQGVNVAANEAFESLAVS